MNNPRKPRWIQRADGSILDIETGQDLCGHVGHKGARCTRPRRHIPAKAHMFERQYPGPREDPQPSTAGYPYPASLIDWDAGPNLGKSKADQFLDTSLDPVLDPPYPGPKPSSMYPHDNGGPLPKPPAWRTHPEQLRYASSRVMTPGLHPEIERSELHHMIDQLYDHALNTGKPIDLATFKLETHADTTTGRLFLRTSATTKAPTPD